MVTVNTIITDLAVENGLSRRTLNVCAAAGIDTIGKLLTMDDSQLLHLRNCGRHTQLQLSTLRDKYIYLEHSSTAEAVPQPAAPLQLEFDLGSLSEPPTPLPQSPVLLINLQTCYQRLFRQMSIRACNVMREYVDFRSVLPILEGRCVPNFATLQHCGEKTVQEINKMLDAFSVLYHDELERFRSCGHTIEYIHDYFSLRYSFLSHDDCLMLAREYGLDKPLPLLFLVERYICNSNNNCAVFLREHYGFDPDGKSHSLAEIANKYHLTRERVRQVLVHGLQLPPSIGELIEARAAIFVADVYGGTDPLWAQLARENHLPDLSVLQLMALVAAVKPEYMIQTITGTPFIYLVRRRLLSNIQVMNTFKRLRQPIDNRHTADVEIDIMKVLKEVNSGPLHERVEAILPIFIDPLLAIDGVEHRGNGRLVSHPNRYDPQKLIVDALHALGRDSTLEQIQNEIARQYGTSPIKNLQSLHAYILRNDQVTPIGRSGRYVLRNWDNYFTGSITDFIALYLEQVDSPLSPADIAAHVMKTYPNTTSSGVVALMYLDARKRFVSFRGGRYGLSNKQYQGDWQVNTTPRSGRSFADRLREFKSFVDEHGFIPYGSKPETGSHIAHWIYNIKNNVLAPTDDELQQFNDYIARTAHLPQNYSELCLHNVIQRIRQVVDDTGQLPSRAAYPIEVDWLNRLRKGKVQFTPNKQRWWDELRTYLQERGLL